MRSSIVLTDYIAGMKMLDVQRSAQASDTARRGGSDPVPARVSTGMTTAHRQHPLALELGWFIRLRWIAGAVVTLSGALDAFSFTAIPIPFMFFLLGQVILFYNLALLAVPQNSRQPKRGQLRPLAVAQMLLDLICLSALVGRTVPDCTAPSSASSSFIWSSPACSCRGCSPISTAWSPSSCSWPPSPGPDNSPPRIPTDCSWSASSLPC